MRRACTLFSSLHVIIVAAYDVQALQQWQQTASLFNLRDVGLSDTCSSIEVYKACIEAKGVAGGPLVELELLSARPCSVSFNLMITLAATDRCLNL